MKQRLSLLDRRLTLAVQQWPRYLRPLMRGVSLLGLSVVAGSVGFVSLVLSFLQGNFKISLAFALGFVALGVGMVLKRVLRRERPALQSKNQQLRSYSLPSGHAFSSSLLYGLLVYLAVIHLPAGFIIASGIGGLILLIGLSRVYLGEHYLFDVLVGWALGGFVLIALIMGVL